jgi:XRE family transcriptional regulator, fatty acid utilization regulator
MPAVARALTTLHRRYRDAADQVGALVGVEGPIAHAEPHDEIRDFFGRRHNHVAELDAAAEELAREEDIAPGAAAPALVDRLQRRHGVRVVDAPSSGAVDPRAYDPAGRTLRLDPLPTPGRRAFQAAIQLAALE